MSIITEVETGHNHLVKKESSALKKKTFKILSTSGFYDWFSDLLNFACLNLFNQNLVFYIHHTIGYLILPKLCSAWPIRQSSKPRKVPYNADLEMMSAGRN